MISLACKFGKVVLLAAVFVLLTGCNYGNQLAGRADAQEPISRSAWLAYWDLDAGEKDLQRMGEKLDKLSYFAAYFDADDHPVIPRELSERHRELAAKKGNYESYLTFVNDRQNPDGSSELKDLEVLRRLLADETARRKHIDEIIALTLRGGYDGIELDYERIWRDKEIARCFPKFTDELYEQARKNNLKVRIVLEPGTPFSTVAFTPGPEYIVMLYNLYGTHSGPGPKANKEFIQKTLTRMKSLPGKKSVALATGGGQWGDNGERRFLTENEAKDLAVQHGVTTRRDESSQCLVFAYNDQGAAYEVWYADGKTINYWIAIAKEQGVQNISLWRLGE